MEAQAVRCFPAGEDDSGGWPSQEHDSGRPFAQRRASGWLEDLRAGGSTLDGECGEFLHGECGTRGQNERREPGNPPVAGRAGDSQGGEERPGDPSVQAEGSPGDVMDLTGESICALASVW